MPAPATAGTCPASPARGPARDVPGGRAAAPPRQRAPGRAAGPGPAAGRAGATGPGTLPGRTLPTDAPRPVHRVVAASAQVDAGQPLGGPARPGACAGGPRTGLHLRLGAARGAAPAPPAPT